MFSTIVHLFQSVFEPTKADVGPSFGLKARLAAAPLHQTDALIANEHLQGFLKAVFRLREEERISDPDWVGVTHFLTGQTRALPPAAAHLVLDWPRARDTSSTLTDLFRSHRGGMDDSPAGAKARCQVLLGYLTENAKGESWLSHGFKLEFQDLCRDPAIDPLDRIEVVDVAELKLGPMDGEQLRACVQRIARLRGLLAADAYPCIHDVLTRMSNEASWQLDLFSQPDDCYPHPRAHPLVA